MKNQQVRTWARGLGGVNLMGRERGRSAGWKTWLGAILRPIALPGVLLLLLIMVISVPLPANAAQIGSGWATHITTGAATGSSSGTTTLACLADTRVSFTGALNPSLGRTSVTILIQKMGTNTSTVGTMTTLAGRVFNTQPVTLPSLFGTMGMAAQPNTTYRIVVNERDTVLTSATLTLTR